jgi:hypothetical protein
MGLKYQIVKLVNWDLLTSIGGYKRMLPLLALKSADQVDRSKIVNKFVDEILCYFSICAIESTLFATKNIGLFPRFSSLLIQCLISAIQVPSDRKEDFEVTSNTSKICGFTNEFFNSVQNSKKVTFQGHSYLDFMKHECNTIKLPIPLEYPCRTHCGYENRQDLQPCPKS